MLATLRTEGSTQIVFKEERVALIASKDKSVVYQQLCLCFLVLVLVIMGVAIWLQRLALARVRSERVKSFIQSPSGPFTVFFWAPICKWCIVIANFSDLRIPAENISMPQQFVLMMSGLTWSRYCFQIYPFSWNLVTVQIFMAGSAIYQIGRRIHLLF